MTPEPTEVRSMFARIAGRYDLLNRVLSAGIDQRWRRRTVRRAGPLAGRVVVDVCCGTGDLALAFAAQGARVVGVDFTPQMLSCARTKGRAGAARATPLFVEGDALRLPLPDGIADVASIAFGLRNLGDRAAGLAELARVVRPGGQVLVLEFTTPKGRLFGAAYRTYFTRVLPRIGGFVSGDAAAYTYLPCTVLSWPTPEELAEEMAAAGLDEASFETLTGGIACLHRGRVPETPR